MAPRRTVLWVFPMGGVSRDSHIEGENAVKLGPPAPSYLAQKFQKHGRVSGLGAGLMR